MKYNNNHWNGWMGHETMILRMGWHLSVTARIIANQLPDRTRNAVIGKAHRLHLPEHNEWRSKPLPAPEPARQRPPARPKTGTTCVKPDCSNNQVFNSRGLCSTCDQAWIRMKRPVAENQYAGAGTRGESSVGW